MSKTVDQRVVEMRFDNREFEKNVKTSMNSLERLKQSLNFKGATKGVENLSTATKNVNMNALGTAVESVRMKFSALEVMGVTALANITNQAVNAGKRFASAFTIDPLKTGFQEYETQINAVQTILANTSSKGTDLDDVNQALDTLNTYADKTIYNFTEMTRNIGTFTAAGVDLDTSVNAIQGIANLAAVSGSTSQQASTAMYQLSQALASGTVKLMDWNSVVNAGMGGEVFQNALKETARVHGIAIDEMIKNEGSFRETLSEGWLTSDILTETLQKFTLTTEGLTQAEIERNREMLKSKGYTDQQIDDIFKLGKTATDAATKVKTFTQLFDTLKEAAQSGWTQTWELVVGDFEESKEFLTSLSDMFGGFINASSEARNNLLSGALSSKWEEFTKKINKAGISTEDFTKKLRETGKEGGVSISGLIKRYGSLERAFAAGAIPTKLVTKTLNKFAGEASSASKSTEELESKLKEFQKIVDDVWQGDYGNGEDRIQALTKAGYDYAKVQKLVNKAEGGRKLTLEDLSEAELVAIGYTKDEAKAIRDLAREAQEAGTPLNELVENLGKPSGRQLLIDSFKNALSGIVSVLSAVKKAWVNVFPPMTSEQLYGIIEAVNAFSQHLVVGDKTAENLTRTFKGVFALLDIILTLVTGPIKVVVDGIMQVLKEMNVDILHYTALLGDGIVAVRDWIDQHNIFAAALRAIIPYLKKAFYGVKDWIEGFGEAEDIPKYIIQGLVNGLRSGAQLVVECIIDLAKKIKGAFTGEFEIESPSKVSFEWGKYIIEGLVNGLKEFGSNAVDVIKNVFSKIFEWVQKIDFGKVFAVFLGIGLIVVAKKFANVAEMFVNPISAVADALEGLGKMMGAIAFDKRASGMLKLAGAVAILAASIALLTLVDPIKLIAATLAIGGIITAMIFLMKALGSMDLGTSITAVALASIIASIVLLIVAINKLSKIRIDDPISTIVAITGIIMALASLMFVCTKLKGGSLRTSFVIGQLTLSMFLLIGLIKLANSLSMGEILKGGSIVAGLSVFLLAIAGITRIAGSGMSNFGSTVRKLVVSLALMVGVVKLISLLKVEELLEATLFMSAMTVFILAMAGISRLCGKHIGVFGGAMVKISLALLALIGVCKLAGMLSIDDIKRGITVISVLSVLIMGLIAVSNLAGKHASAAGTMLLKISIALTILTAVAFLLGQIDPDDLIRGLISITILTQCVAGLIAVTKLSKVSDKLISTLTRFTIIIGILGALIIGMSFLDPMKVMTASVAMTMVISALSLLVASTHYFKHNKNMYKSLWTMLGIIAILAGIVTGLSFINGDNALKSAGALSMVMLAFAASLAIASAAGKISKTVVKTMGPMLAVVTLLGLIIAGLVALNQGNKVGSAIEAAGAVSMLMLALGTTMVIMKHTGKLAKGVSTNTLIMAGVVASFAALIGVLEKLDVGVSIENALSVSVLALALAGVTAILSTIGAGSFMAALEGAGALLLVGLAVGALVAEMVSIGWLFKKIPDDVWTDMMSGLARMTDVMSFMANSVGRMIGEFVGGLGAGLISGSVGAIDGLRDMVGSIKELADEAKTIDASSLTGLKTMAEILLILSGAEMINSINRLFGSGLMGGSGMLDSLFGRAVSKGPNSISVLKQLGDVAVSFAKSTSELTASDIDRIKLGAEAIKVLAEASKQIPKTDGAAGAIFGEIDVGGFGTGLSNAATGISDFASKCSSFTEDTVKQVEFGAEAIAKIAEAAQKIPNTGGFAAEWSGDNTIGEFCKQLSGSADGIIDFANKMSVAKFNEETVKTVGYGVQAIAVIAKEAANIPNTGGLAGLLAGENDIGQFCAQLPGVATNLKSFADNLGTFTSDNVEAVEQVVTMINSFSELSTNITSLATYLEVVSRDLNDFAGGIKGFVGTMNEIGSPNIATAVTNTNMIISAIDTLKNTSAGHVEELGSAMSVFASKGVQSFVKALTNTDSISKCKDAGSEMASKAIQGIKDRMNAKIDGIESVGRSFAKGFKRGMESEKSNIWDAAVSLAQKAIDAVKSATDTNSPSRVAFGLGGFFGIGFVNGIIDNVKDSAVAGETIANSARQGVVDALKTANALMTDELNVQPTIRPVIDLSDVKTGVGAISSLLDLSPSTGILANVGAINASMSQNGTDFDDVIDAIRELRDDIKNMKTVVNQIDGVTYDDGSNIASAIEQIVRAVITERRR